MPQIHNALKAGSGHVAQKGWNVPAERPEYIAEDYRNGKIRSNSRSEFSRNRLQDENTDQAYDSVKHCFRIYFFTILIVVFTAYFEGKDSNSVEYLNCKVTLVLYEFVLGKILLKRDYQLTSTNYFVGAR